MMEGIECWPCMPRVSGSISGTGNLKKLFIWMKIHGLTQNIRLRSEQLEQISGNNECCSAPSWHLVATYVKDILSRSTKNTNSNRVID